MPSPPKSSASTAPFDVAVLGAGIAGSALAAILARHGVRTALIDAGTHPRFSIGESTIPTTSLMWQALGQRFDVPELGHLAGYANVSRHISKSCGVKKTFGFIHHRDGVEPTRGCAYQLGVGPVGGFETHMFRQDVDAYIFAAAVRHGAVPLQSTRIGELAFDDDGVTLTLERGGALRARFVVDGTGPGSPFARQLGLRAAEPAMRTRTRSLFTHMIGVRRFDDCVPERVGPAPFWEGTQHHLFDGGWFWIIPFDNAPESLNPLVSVGLTLDLDRHPLGDADPEAEFRAIAARFPAVQRQLAEARAVRPWVRSRRLQWDATRTIAPRYAMLASTAGFVGPLFSLGLGHTAEAITWLAPRLLAAVAADDFAEARFEGLDGAHRRCLAQHDALVHGAFVSFRDPDLWDAWFRVWCVSQLPREMALVEAMDESRRLGAQAAWDRFESAHDRHPFARVSRRIFDAAVDVMDRYEAGELTAAAAADTIRALFETADLGPLGGVLRTERHLLVPGRRRRGLLSAARWVLSGDRTPESTGTWRRFVSAAARVGIAEARGQRQTHQR